MSTDPVFRYEGYDVDLERGLLICLYSLGSRIFEDRVTFSTVSPSVDKTAVLAAARLVFLLAGFSYYKTAPSRVIDLGNTSITKLERDLLLNSAVNSTTGFPRRNGVERPGIMIDAQARPARTAMRPGDDRIAGEPGRPIVPFNGGIDSIVATEIVRQVARPVLFTLSRPNERHDAVELPAAVSGLTILRAEREIDQQVHQDQGFSFPNEEGTVEDGILSAISVMAAILGDCNTVAMPHGWCTSVRTFKNDGRVFARQYFKSAAYEIAFRHVVAEAFEGRIRFFSVLRPFSDLWIAQRFATLSQYHDTFLTCRANSNADTSQQPQRRCGDCDECCVVDLLLAPFMAVAELRRIFGGREPLDKCNSQAHVAKRFEALLGHSTRSGSEPCITDIGEFRAALALASQRPDREASGFIHAMAGRLPIQSDLATAALLLQPIGGHFIPDTYANLNLSA